MKTFIIKDFYFQSMLVSLLLLFSIPSFTRDLVIPIYFLIAFDHLVSANRKIFSGTYRKSIIFTIYYTISMLFIITLFSLAAVDEIYIIDRFWTAYGRHVMSFALYGTPVLALMYYLICLNDYRKEIKHKANGL